MKARPTVAISAAYSALLLELCGFQLGIAVVPTNTWSKSEKYGDILSRASVSSAFGGRPIWEHLGPRQPSASPPLSQQAVFCRARMST